MWTSMQRLCSTGYLLRAMRCGTLHSNRGQIHNLVRARDVGHFYLPGAFRPEMVSLKSVVARGLHTATDAWPQTICADICSNEELRAALIASLESYKMLPDRESNYFPREVEGSRDTSIFAFPGSHNVEDWVSNFEFEQCLASEESILQPHFAGLSGHVHKGFARRLGTIVRDSKLMGEIDTALTSSKRIIFTGHSLGGAVATLAALMLLNRVKQSSGDHRGVEIVCCTFAAPLVGDAQLGATVTANGWADSFMHVVWRHDIVPRLLLSPGNVLDKAGGVLREGTQLGLQTFLRKVSGRQACSNAAANSGGGSAPVGEAPAAAERRNTDQEIQLSERESAAMAELADGLMEGCKAEAIAMRGGNVGTGGVASIRGLRGAFLKIGRAVQGASHKVLSVGRALAGLRDGLLDSGTFRPFGTYLLHTTSGSLVCREPKEALQMLYLTMVTQSGAVDAKKLDIVDEHMGHCYQVAVEAIISADALKEPKWRSLDYLISDTKSLFELGIIGVAQDVLRAQSAILDILRKEYQRPPQWYEREQSWLIAQDAMDVIYLYRQRHEDAGTDYCEAFKAHKHEEDREVERARRVLRVFWDITVGMYTSGDLPQKFFERGVWLIRATSYMELVEPIEIANYYRCHNWKRWRKGERHYIEGKRPKRFPFFEAQYAIHYTEEKLAPVLDQARREADAVELQELAAVEA